MHPAPGPLFAGRFQIERMLGEGAFGRVYAATQVDLGRRVALKVLHPDVVLRESAVERFLREAQVVQSLSHPHVVRLLDHGRTSDGLPFIAYELLEGRSLEDTLRRDGPFPAQRAQWIGIQMLRGLLEAHALGVVHRDIKPANVFLCEYEGETDFVKIVDFGVAAIANQSGPVLTRAGASVGTPAYMAPEQMLGAAIDGRSDVYAVGLVLAEMLTGRRVFAGDNGMAVGLLQISDAPVPLDPALRGSVLGRVIARAVEKDVANRLSARGFLQALEAVADNRSISLPPLHAPRASRQWLIVLVALLSISGLLLAGLGAWVWRSDVRERAPVAREKVRSPELDESDTERASVDEDPDAIFGEIEKRRFRGLSVSEVRRRVLAEGWSLRTQNVMAPSPSLKVYAMSFDKQDRTLGVLVSCKSGDDPNGRTIAEGCFKRSACIEAEDCTLMFYAHTGGELDATDPAFERVFSGEP